MTGRMKILPIIQELMDRIVRDDEIEIDKAIEALLASSGDVYQRDEVYKAFVSKISGDWGYAANTETELRALALEFTDLVEPETQA